jgi:acetyl-CoA acetyltransferase
VRAVCAGASQSVSARVHQAAGTTRADVDCLQVYDNFTSVALFALEGFGFCDTGKGWQWLRDHSIAYDGDLPMNTSGGHTAESYMQGWALLVEAVRQVRGEAGARQVDDCDIAQYICASPIVSSHVLIGA